MKLSVLSSSVLAIALGLAAVPSYAASNLRVEVVNLLPTPISAFVNLFPADRNTLVEVPGSSSGNLTLDTSGLSGESQTIVGQVATEYGDIMIACIAQIDAKKNGKLAAKRATITVYRPSIEEAPACSVTVK
jgi:hypothetical protein